MAVNLPWQTTTATVASSEFHYTRLMDIDMENESYNDKSYYVVQFRYNVTGQEFFGTLELHDPLSPGEQFAISYNPDDPAQNSTAPRKITISIRLAVWVFGTAIVAGVILLCNHFGLASD